MRFTTAFVGVVAAQIGSVFAQSSAASAPASQGTDSPPGQLSDLGTDNAPTLQQFVPSCKPLVDGFPWGDRSVTNTNQYNNPPRSNCTRKYDLTITRGSINAANRGNRSSILINGQFPGPTLEANWGDTFEITVHNKIVSPEEPTSLHWHGFLQKGSEWEDGVPGIQQCPIAPGATQVFTFTADLYGSSWYHSHFTAQYAGGILGPVVVHGPLHGPKYDVDLGPVVLCEWYDKPYDQLVAEVVDVGPGLAPKAPAQLINGRTNSVFNMTKGKAYRMRITNTAAKASYVYSIDEHQFTVIAQDFVPVQPYVAKNITLGVGQRADIIVNATGDSNKSYFIRSEATECSSADFTIPNSDFALATIFYEKANRNQKPTSISGGHRNQTCTFPILDVQPEQTFTPPSQPATTYTMDITHGNNGSGNPVFFINGNQFHVNYDDPPLLLAHSGNTSYPANDPWNVENFGSNSSVRIIVNNFFKAAEHPMHLHGHNFWVLSQGHGFWDGKTITNPQNPQLRDVYIVTEAPEDGNPSNTTSSIPSHIVIEFNQDNPGVWPFHCHIAWHVSAGLYISVLERPADIVNLPIPQKTFQTCDNYKAWQAKGNIVDEIDSGLRKRTAAEDFFDANLAKRADYQPFSA